MFHQQSGAGIPTSGDGSVTEPWSERRTAGRRRAYQTAHIRFNRNNSSYEALVRDFSPGGAKLRFGDRAELPERFEMRIGADGAYRVATVAWRHGFECGIAYLG
jgi:hypothetical protein